MIKAEELLAQMTGLIGNPAWAVFEKYTEIRIEAIREQMDTCSESEMKMHQGELRILKDHLTLRHDVVRITSGTKG